MGGLLRADARGALSRGGGAVLALIALAVAADPRAEGDAADAAGRHAEALAAWRLCAETSPDRDARYCAARAATLAPQEADGFAGWEVLERVRREYRNVPTERSLATVEAALARLPSSPAAPAMRAWIANERLKRGDTTGAAALALEGPVGDWRDARLAAAERERWRRRVAAAGGLVAAVYAIVALVGNGALRLASAALAALLLGAAPAVLAQIYDGSGAEFALAGAVVATGVLASGRAPGWIAAPGTIGAFLLVAWWNGWTEGMGW